MKKLYSWSSKVVIIIRRCIFPFAVSVPFIPVCECRSKGKIASKIMLLTTQRNASKREKRRREIRDTRKEKKMISSLKRKLKEENLKRKCVREDDYSITHFDDLLFRLRTSISDLITLERQDVFDQTRRPTKGKHKGK